MSEIRKAVNQEEGSSSIHSFEIDTFWDFHFVTIWNRMMPEILVLFGIGLYQNIYLDGFKIGDFWDRMKPENHLVSFGLCLSFISNIIPKLIDLYYIRNMMTNL